MYAHTDEEAERQVLFSLGFEAASESEWIPYGERYTPFPEDLLRPVIDLCNRLQGEMYAEAKRVWIELGRPEGEL